MIIAFTVNYGSKDTKFYLDSAAEVHICYDKLLFSIYNKKNSLLVCTMDYIELRLLGKDMVTLDLFIDGKPKVINLCNILHTPELEDNLLSVSIIEKVGYLILAKKEKMIVFDNKNNVAFEATRIRTSYLVNILASKKTLALAFLRLVSHNHASWT